MIDPRLLTAFSLPATATREDLAQGIVEAAGLTAPSSPDSIEYLERLACATVQLVDEDREPMIDLTSEAPNAVLTGPWASEPQTVTRARETFESLAWPAHPDADWLTKEWHTVGVVALALERAGFL